MTDKRGSVPLLVCGIMPAILLTGVFAADATRVWLARSRLQAALDAGALVGARDFNSANRTANVQAVVAANYNANLPPGATQLDPSSVTVNPIGANQVQVGATADVTTLLSTLGGSNWSAGPNWTNRTVARSATGVRTTTGIELALVMDTTLSMALWDSAGGKDADGSKPARIELARRAGRDLTNILYGAQTEYQPNLYISVVPFNIAINIGTDNAAWLKPDNASYPQGFSWSGCVEARTNGEDATDSAPTSTATKFPRYYWPSTYDAAKTSAATGSGNSAAAPFCTVYQDYASGSSAGGACTGDNDWTAPAATQNNNPLLQYFRAVPGYFGSYVRSTTTTTFSPNIMCPTVPILPLTMHRGKVEATIDALVGTPVTYTSSTPNGLNTTPNSTPSTYYGNTPFPMAYGTVIASGLQGAWYTLSPSWRGLWPNPNPLIGNKQLSPPSALPLDYNTPHMNKVVLLLSDGDNNWFNSRTPQGQEGISGTGSGNTLVRPSSRRTELFYSAYGRLSADSNRLNIAIPTTSLTETAANTQALANDYATIRTRADSALNAVTLDLCSKMKAKGIIIYAVGLGVAEQEHHDLLQACVTPASSNERNKYIRTNNAGELRAAFTQVANELATLRLAN